MQLLGSSDKIIFDKTYPYETRNLAYLYRLTCLPFMKKTDVLPWGNESLFMKEYNYMGPLPRNTNLIRDTGRFKKDIFKRIWNGFSAEIAKNYNNTPIFYAEKIPNDIPRVLNQILPCKNILLLRDPRDELVSILSFNKKRNSNDFGWKSDDTIESFAIRHANARKGFIKHYLNGENDSRTIRISYEDLIDKQVETTKYISTWLDIELNPNVVQENLTTHLVHMTSKSPMHSLKRWKKELPSTVIEIYTNVLGSELKELGYDD